MASRTSASVPMMVGMSTLALLCLVLFVLGVVFAAKTQKLTADLNTARSDLARAVRPDERDDRWEELKRLAGDKMGVVRYLDQGYSQAMRLSTGNAKDTPESFKDRLAKAYGPDAPAMMKIIQDKDDSIAQLKKDLDQANSQRDTAQSDLKAASDRLAAVQGEDRKTIEALTSQIGEYKAELDRYRGGVETAQASMEDRVRRIRSESDKSIADLQGKLNSEQQELLINSEQLKKALGQNTHSFKPGDESALVDARVVGVDLSAGRVYIGVGRKQHAVLGLPFEVYSLGTSITPDKDGNYPPGKASLEIVHVDENSSLARITRQTRGNPVIVGDAVANAVYDPNKQYTFAVYGNFDTNGDGVATPEEAKDISTMIQDWGGTVSDSISGSTDFVVLGERPVLPPEPRPEDPVELINRYLTLKKSVQKYDDMFDSAKRTSIPILNQNRLYTLTGLHGQR